MEFTTFQSSNWFTHSISPLKTILWRNVQVSLAICVGYVPEKFESVNNNKTAIQGLNLWKFPSYLRFSLFFWPVNSKNHEYQAHE